MGCDSYPLYDNINPKHYRSHPSGVEAIEILRHATDYDLGTAMAYLWRVMWGSKGRDLEDVKKACWYLQDWVAVHEEQDS